MIHSARPNATRFMNDKQEDSNVTLNFSNHFDSSDYDMMEEDRIMDQLSNRHRKEQMRQYHYRFMELEPVAELDEEETMLQPSLSVGTSFHLFQTSVIKDADNIEMEKSDRVQQLEDELQELREQNELLEFRLLEMEQSCMDLASQQNLQSREGEEFLDSRNNSFCSNKALDVKQYLSSKNMNEYNQDIPKSTERIVATVLPFTNISNDSSVIINELSRYVKLPKYSDSSQESGIFEDDDFDIPSTCSRASQTEPNITEISTCKLCKLESKMPQTDFVNAESTNLQESTKDELQFSCNPVYEDFQNGYNFMCMEENSNINKRMENTQLQLWIPQKLDEKQKWFNTWLAMVFVWSFWCALQYLVQDVSKWRQYFLKNQGSTVKEITKTEKKISDPIQCKCELQIQELRQRLEEMEQKEMAYIETMQKADDIWCELEAGFKLREEKAEKALQENTEKLELLEQKLKSATSDRSQLIMQLEELESENSNLTCHIRTIEDDHVRLQRQNTQLLDAVNQADLSLQQLQQEVEVVLKPELNKERKVSIDLQRNMEHTLTELELQYQNKVNESNKKLQKVTNDLNDVNCECEQLKEEVDTLEATVLRLRTQIHMLKEKEEKLIINLNSKIESLETLVTENQRTKCCEVSLHQELGDSFHSILKENLESHSDCDILNKENLKGESCIISDAFPNLDKPIHDLSNVVRGLDATLEYIKVIRDPPLIKSSVFINHPKVKPEVPPKKVRSRKMWCFNACKIEMPQEKHLVQQKKGLALQD